MDFVKVEDFDRASYILEDITNAKTPLYSFLYLTKAMQDFNHNEC